jgi:hypothetical protein
MCPPRNVTPAEVAQAFIQGTTDHQVDLTDVERDVAQLAKSVEIDSFDVSEQAVSIDGSGHFSGEGTVYVSLEYPEEVTVSEELPVAFEGSIDTSSGQIRFENVRVDLSPFYGDEPNEAFD